MRLLLIEDDVELVQQIGSGLRDAGYAVDCSREGQDGWFLGQAVPFDLAVLDLGLPGLSGIDVIRRWRASGVAFPILILTARDRWQDKVEGLNAGADDYLTKPFHFEELSARIKALLRRAAGVSGVVVERGPVRLDLAAQEVHVGERRVELTAQEYKVLEYLMLHAGTVVSKTTLTEHMYDQDFELDSNVIEVFVARVRRKLDPDNRLRPIETLRGRGYRFAGHPR
ncbi:response regulator transcription factor [Methylotetracoccus oryzae]|uniref:response regulator transcription factor n=1 Tax=Methylotetracoccus oryzae TaxID=1919059 RepID=UPI001117D018|nr:response regulator transcription factor [Methylotetracoccus oryzae]